MGYNKPSMFQTSTWDCRSSIGMMSNCSSRRAMIITSAHQTRPTFQRRLQYSSCHQTRLAGHVLPDPLTREKNPDRFQGIFDASNRDASITLQDTQTRSLSFNPALFPSTLLLSPPPPFFPPSLLLTLSYLLPSYLLMLIIFH